MEDNNLQKVYTIPEEDTVVAKRKQSELKYVVSADTLEQNSTPKNLSKKFNGNNNITTFAGYYCGDMEGCDYHECGATLDCGTCEDTCQCSAEGCEYCQCSDEGCEYCECSDEGCEYCECSDQGCQYCDTCQCYAEGCEYSCQYCNTCQCYAEGCQECQVCNTSQSFCGKGKQAVSYHNGSWETGTTKEARTTHTTYESLAKYINRALKTCRYETGNKLSETMSTDSKFTKDTYDALKTQINRLYSSSGLGNVVAGATKINYAEHIEKMKIALDNSKLPDNIPCCENTNYQSCVNRQK